MKKIVLLSAMGALSAIGAVANAEEVGRVISSTPVVQQVAVPRQVCNTVQYVQPQSSGGGALVGAIIGGLLGNGIGHGVGRAAATGIGAVAGAAVGDNIETRGGYPQAAQQCSTQNSYENRTVGYNVVYEYGGKQFSVQMPNDPGPNVRLNVSPVGASSAAPYDDQGVVTAPAVGQPVGQIVGVPTTSVAPTYYAPAPVYYAPAPAYYAPAYYAPSYYPPVSLSLGFGFYGGGGHWGRHHGGHWR
jgi:uncharacterized protein YcfJ